MFTFYLILIYTTGNLEQQIVEQQGKTVYGIALLDNMLCNYLHAYSL